MSALHEAVEYHDQQKVKNYFLRQETDSSAQEEFRQLRSEIATRIQATLDPELILREGSVDLRHIHTFAVDQRGTFLREQAFSIQFDGDHVVVMFHIPNISAYFANENIKNKVVKSGLQAYGKLVSARMGYGEDRATRSFTFEQRFNSFGNVGFITKGPLFFS